MLQWTSITHSYWQIVKIKGSACTQIVIKATFVIAKSVISMKHKDTADGIVVSFTFIWP